MENSFTLKYSLTFYEDFEKIISYIRDDLENYIAANNLIDTVEKEIYNRLLNPLGYEKYITKAGNVYYRIYVKNYIIFYTVTNTVMEIRRITYSKRNVKNLI